MYQKWVGELGERRNGSAKGVSGKAKKGRGVEKMEEDKTRHMGKIEREDK